MSKPVFYCEDCKNEFTAKSMNDFTCPFCGAGTKSVRFYFDVTTTEADTGNKTNSILNTPELLDRCPFLSAFRLNDDIHFEMTFVIDLIKTEIRKRY